MDCFTGGKSSAGGRTVPELSLPQASDASMRSSGSSLHLNTFSSAEPLFKWTVVYDSEAKTAPTKGCLYDSVPGGGHLYPSSTLGSLFKWTLVSEAYRMSGNSYPRDHCLAADHAGVQPVMAKEWKLHEPCEFYFGPYGWCPDGHSCRYSHRMQTWLEDRERKGIGRKRMFHEI